MSSADGSVIVYWGFNCLCSYLQMCSPTVKKLIHFWSATNIWDIWCKRHAIYTYYITGKFYIMKVGKYVFRMRFYQVDYQLIWTNLRNWDMTLINFRSIFTPMSMERHESWEMWTDIFLRDWLPCKLYWTMVMLLSPCKGSRIIFHEICYYNYSKYFLFHYSNNQIFSIINMLLYKIIIYRSWIVL